MADRARRIRGGGALRALGLEWITEFLAASGGESRPMTGAPAVQAAWGPFDWIAVAPILGMPAPVAPSLVGAERACYCPAELEEGIPPQPVSDVTAPLPLPPLPPEVVGYGVSFYPPLYWSHQRSAKPRVWTVFVAFIVALVAGLGVGTVVPVMVVAAQHRGTFASPDELMEMLRNSIAQPLVLLSSGLGTQLMLLVVALSAALLSPVKPVTRRLRLNRSGLSPVGYVVAGIGALAVSFLFGYIVALLRIKESGTLKLFAETFSQLSPIEVAFAVLIVGVLPGFAEEFLFRGYTQTRLVLRWGRWVGIIITALLFGIMHMDVMQSPFAAAFGIYLGFLAEKAGSIRPTMFCHMLNNSIEVLLGRYANGGGGEELTSQGYMIRIVVMSAVLAACVLYIAVLVRPPAKAESSELASVATV